MVTGYTFRALSDYTYNRNQDQQKELSSSRAEVVSLDNKIVTLNNELGNAKVEIADLSLQQQYLNMKLQQKQQTYSGKVMVAQDVGSILKIQATAYVPTCEGCSGVTKTGVDVRKGVHKLIAVDPKVVPLNKKVELTVDGKSWGIWETKDIGGDIQGFRIDILMPTLEQAMEFGRQDVVLKIVG
jgi:3D (Asp-Asp-Asp) domain-containing protein